MILTKQKIKSIDLDLLIGEKIGSGNVSELLLIFPTNRKVRNIKKEIVSAVPGKAATGLFVETLGTISSKLLNQSLRFTTLSEAAATVFLKQSAGRQKLHYFSNYKNDIPAGTLDRIKNVISEYKKSGISPDVLLKEAEKLEKSEKLKAIDIAAIYKTYNSICHSLKSFETGDIYEFLNALDKPEFENNFISLYEPVRTIILTGFDDFTIPEINIIESLSGLKNIELYINFDYNRHNKSLFGHLDNTYEKLSARGFEKIDDTSPSNRDEFSEIVRDNLFAGKVKTPHKKYSDKLTVISAFDRDKEITAIAKEIKKLIVRDKVEPHKICVVFNLIKHYSSAVRDLFGKHGIPFNLSDRQSLSSSPPVTALVNFLEIAENDYYYKNIFRVLNDGFIDLGEIDTPNLMRIASELKIIVGRENWHDSITSAAANLKFESGEKDIDDKKQKYNKALADIKFLENILAGFEKKQTIAEFKNTLEDFIYKSGIPLKLIDNEFASEENIKAVTTFIDTVNEIFSLMEEDLGPDKKFSLKFFMEQIRTACGWARYNVKEKSDYGVLITTLEEIRGLKFDYIFIAGLCDGDLPTRYNPEIFFSGSFVKKAIIHQLEERYRFYQVLCSWKRGLYLTYPFSQAGKESVVSTFLKDFEKHFVCTPRSDSDYSETYSSNEEVQLLAGSAGIDKMKEHYAGELKELLPEAGKIETAINVEINRSEDSGSESVFNGTLTAADLKIFNGLLSAEEFENKFDEFKDKQYSVSQLETYAKCPFKFFVERVLNIEMMEEPTEEIEALEMGRVLHEIFFEFYSQIRNMKITLQGCSDEVFEKSKKLIFEIAERVIEQSSFKSPVTFFEKEKITGLGGNQNESILYRFLESERSGDVNFLPQYFEVSFGRIRKEGSDDILGDPEPVMFGEVKIRGKIDRIETGISSDAYNIVDYKLSGSKPGASDFSNGISLQLPVYLKAAGNLLQKKFGKDYSAGNMYIYSLKYKADEFGKKKISSGRGKAKDSDGADELINNAGEFIQKYVEGITKGRFNLSVLKDREEKICRFCGFKPVCRVDEILG